MTLTQQCKDENEMYHFSFNESYVWEREKVFQINLELQCKISFKMQMQQITHQMTILYCVFFNNFNNLIFNVFEDEKDFLKEKLLFTFQKGPSLFNESTENQKPNEQAMIKNPIHSFNANKNKKQTNIVFSIA
jgi:hypothetical protein